MIRFRLALLASVIIGSSISLIAQSKGFDYTGMDKSFKPGDDFNQYINGTWLRTTEIPGDQSRWGSFITLNEENNKKLRLIMEEAAKAASEIGSPQQKIGDFYFSAMDTNTIERLDFDPVKKYFGRVDVIKDLKGIIKEASIMHTLGFDPLFGFYAYQDDKNSEKVIAQFGQASLGLPEKGYYFDNDANKEKIRVEYKNYISKLFEYIGYDKAKAGQTSKAIFEFETELAKVSKNNIELRDPEANYNKFTASQLAKMIPNLGFDNIQTNLRIQEDTFLMGQPEFYKSLNTILAKTSLQTLKDYLKLEYINGLAPYLSKRFQTVAFNFSKEFSGQKKQQERGKRMVNLVNGKLGELIGQVYVEKYFPAAAKTKMLELVKNLQAAYEVRIKQADWMDSVTKDKAITKLNGMLLKIGYPDIWKDYTKLQVTRTGFIQNVINGNMFSYMEMIAKLQKPVDKNEWLMSPAIVNAYYNPQTNEIAFPAGILQPPFFDIEADDAVNYGAIGAVIGHEMTHGFDDQGRLYDASGNLGDWWTKQDADNYKIKADKIILQYSAFTVFDTVHVKGDLTLGENIADIGGIAIAYDAFKQTAQGKGTDLIDGFTPDQRFFFGWGQIWRSKNTVKFQMNRINTDVHSPEEFRINGALSNFTPWYNAFDVKMDNKMYRKIEDRISIW